MNFAIAVSLMLLMLALCAGLYRIAKERQAIERFLAIQLMGTVAVAIVVLVSLVQSDTAAGFDVHKASAIIDVALIFALLAVITVATYVQRAWRQEKSTEDGGS